MVKVLEGAEEPKQAGVIVEVLVHILKLLNHLNELAHDVGEDGHAQQKQHGSNQAFHVASGAEVAEPYRGQRGEGEIDKLDELLVLGVLVEVVEADEVAGN